MSSLAKNEFLPEYDDSGRQENDRLPFAIDKPERARREVIRVVAVGGGGGNAINHIIGKGIEGVELLAVNTDMRSLEMSMCKDTLILGEKSTKGLGAGAIPEVGEMAARESIAEIRSFLRGADMVYFTAGMGGGTGTGALPVIAAAAKEMGILTVAVVTKPFSFEGARKKKYAEAGIERLRDCVDALVVVPNDRLLAISKKETTLSESFSLADEVLRLAVLGVTNLITRPGLVNVDFADLKTVMSRAGRAVMGVGVAEGDDRIAKALKQAVESPLMEFPMKGAKGALMNITCGNDLGIYEIYEAASYVETLLSEDATFIWGCVEDPELEGKVEIVIIATAIDEQPPAEPARTVRQYAQQQPQRKPAYQGSVPRQDRLRQFNEPAATAPAEAAPEAAAAGQIAPETAPQAREAEPARDETPAEELVNYSAAEEKPRLISEMSQPGASQWAAGGYDARGKTGSDEFDVPTFTRRGKSLHEAE